MSAVIASPSVPVRRVSVVATALALVFLLSGCLQLSSQLTIRTNDTVSGRVLLAVPTGSPIGELDRLTVPAALSDKVRINNYAANEYRGREIYFTQLSFTEVEALTQSMDAEGQRFYTLSFRRSGDSVIFTGSIDLSAIPPDAFELADTRVDLSFPGSLDSTNGTVAGNNSVSWTPQPGAITRMEATANYADPATRDYAVWMIVGIGAAMLVSIAAVLAARHSRAKSDHLTTPRR